MSIAISKKTFSSAKMKRQAGVTMVEVIIWVVIAAVVALGALQLFRMAKSSISAADTAEKTIVLAAGIQRMWGAQPFTNVTAQEVNKVNAIQPPLTYDGTNMQDPYGNVMLLTGSQNTFAMTLGGATAPLSQDDCATIATRMAAFAIKVNVGSSASAASGLVTGGNAYKNGATTTVTGMTTGCSEASPVVAVEFRRS